MSEVEVPADVLWEVVADLEAMADVLSMVVGVQFHNNKTTPLTIGTRFRESRVCDSSGSVCTLNKTVTRLETSDPQERYLSFGVSFQDRKGRTTNIVNTSTLTVQPMSKKTSRLLLTIAFEWSGAKEIMTNLCCRSRLQRDVRSHMQREVECYCKAAIERHLARSQL